MPIKNIDGNGIIQAWFPTTIYYQDRLISEEENEKCVEHIMKIKETTKKGGDGWNTDVYNTHETYQLHTDDIFKNLCATIKEKTEMFAKELGSDAEYDIDESWFNLYNKDDYQEYHYHPSSHFSAVYFFTNPKNSGNLVFRSPLEPDMLPLKNIDNNDFSWGTCFYNPPAASLLIFRSSLMHMVGRCKNETPRITASFNIA